MKLRPEPITFEMKNGSKLRGIISSVDATMNIRLKDVTMTIKNRNPVTVDSVIIKGSSVFNYYTEDSPPETVLVENSPKKKFKKKDAKGAVKGRGRVRAKKYTT